MNKTILFFAALTSLFFVACGSTSETSTDETIVEETTHEETPTIQVLDPVQFTFTSEKIGDLEYNLIFTAAIEDGWYVYSNSIEDDGPIPTTIVFEEADIIESYGEVIENGDITKDGYDELFDMDIKKFGHSATFTQTVKLSETGTFSGYLEFMTCDSMQCLFPDPVEFSVDVE